MSKVTASDSYIFHTDLGAAVITLQTIANYDVEDVIRDRAISQARAIQLYNQANLVSPNDPTVPRTISSVYAASGEELPT